MRVFQFRHRDKKVGGPHRLLGPMRFPISPPRLLKFYLILPSRATSARFAKFKVFFKNLAEDVLLGLNKNQPPALWRLILSNKCLLDNILYDMPSIDVTMAGIALAKAATIAPTTA